MIVQGTRWRKVKDDRPQSLAEGKLMQLTMAGRTLCVVRMNGVLRVLADACPHQGRSISGGWCDEGHVVCPFHRFHFDPVTGKARHGVCSNIEVFPLEERVDGLYMGFSYKSLRLFGVRIW